MGRVVLVTGVSRDLGGALRAPARRRAGGRAGDRRRRRPARAATSAACRFVRADIRNPVIAKVIAGEDVDTVVHMSVEASPAGRGGGRTSIKEINVIGTMQLLAACQQAPGLERLVVQVLGRGLRLVEPRPGDVHRGHGAQAAARAPASPRTSLEVEGYVRGFARRRPDVAVTMLRAGEPARSARVDTPLTAVLPAAGGPHRRWASTPRLQFLHEDDLVGALHHATLDGVHGTFNVAGDGRADAVPGAAPARPAELPRCPASRWTPSARRCARSRRSSRLPEQIALPDLRPGRGHHPDARRCWASARSTPPRGLRRLRRAVAPGTGPRPGDREADDRAGRRRGGRRRA